MRNGAILAPVDFGAVGEADVFCKRCDSPRHCRATAALRIGLRIRQSASLPVAGHQLGICGDSDAARRSSCAMRARGHGRESAARAPRGRVAPDLAEQYARASWRFASRKLSAISRLMPGQAPSRHLPSLGMVPCWRAGGVWVFLARMRSQIQMTPRRCRDGSGCQKRPRWARWLVSAKRSLSRCAADVARPLS
jgi:hypothetical protein